MNARPGRPEFASFVEVLRHHAGARPKERAFVFLENGETESGTLTYAGLDERARTIAARLQSCTQPGDPVLLLYPPGLEFISAFMGCLYAGVVAVPAYPPRQSRTATRLQSIVADSTVTLALTTASTREGLERRAKGVAGLDGLRWLATDDGEGEAAEWREPAPDWETLAFLQYTSGSTGNPKGVMVTHGNLLHNSEMIRWSFGHDETTVFATWLPLFHDMGLIGNTLHPLHLGIPSILMEPASFIQKPVRWLEAITRYKATTSGGPNSAYELCLRKISDEQKAGLDLRSLRVLYNGAEPVRAETVTRFSEAFCGCGLRAEAMFPCYGLAESTLFVTGADPAALPVIDAFEGRPAVSSGRVSILGQVVIAGPETGAALAAGAVGEIRVAGPHVAKGYWGRPAETARTFGERLTNGDGPFLRTGDLGFLADGELFVTGRMKDLIIVRGRNHYPQDVELTAERAHAALAANGAAAFSVDADGEEQLVVVCEVNRERLRGLDVEAVAAGVRAAIAEEHGVALFALVLLKPMTLPRTSSGKVQRGACRKAFETGEGLETVGLWKLKRPKAEGGAAAAKDSGAIRVWLRERLGAVLGLAAAGIGNGDTFQSLGIDSKDAVEISGELQEWLGRPMPATLLYDYPTIDAVAGWLAPEAEARRTERDEPGLREAIAIVGTGCRFPGGVNPEAFWQMLRDGRDAVAPRLGARLAKFGWPASEAPEWAGLIDDVEFFDAAFFGITRREAEAMDPQQRLLLEVAWEALEDAGIVAKSLAGSATGVFAGISNADYARLQEAGGDGMEPYMATGNALSIAANRISYLLDLRGPSWAVDTACSSSLVAVHQAVRSLQAGECDLALAGGVSLILAPHLSVMFSRAGMLSGDGQCRTFDAGANGYVRGEGAGMVVLKRLRDAVRDGDPVQAVIRGSAVNQDGLTNGMTAPNGPAQQAVVRAAQLDAGVAPGEIGYVEAHGTGTPLGDAMELDTYRTVFGRVIAGSVKSNIGHLEAAAGIAGLIKTVLALRHGMIPQSLHFKQLNAHASRDGAAVEVPEAARPWPRTEKRRCAGVSAFGFGGTNAHVVLEEAPERAPVGGERVAHAVAISARTDAGLRRQCAAVAGLPEMPLGNLAATLNRGRQHFGARRAICVRSWEELRQKLSQPVPARGGTAPRVAFLYTGQGAQYRGMGRQLYETQPVFRGVLERCDELLRREFGIPLLELLFASGPLDDTGNTQPALFALEAALTELWRSWGVRPDAVLGHSVGEYAAAYAAGVFGLEDGLRLIARRGQLMQALPRTGTMISLAAGEEAIAAEVRRFRDVLSIGAINGPAQTVISGDRRTAEAVAGQLEARGIRGLPLTVSHAFHSPLMEPMREAFAAAAARVRFGAPSTPMISNVTGKQAAAELASADYWVSHVFAPVRFSAGMQSLLLLGVDVFVEIGPKPVLLGLGKRCLPPGEFTWLPSLEAHRENWETMLESACALYERGGEIDWNGVDAGFGFTRTAGLPTYPFARERYWVEAQARSGGPEHPLLGRRLEGRAHEPGTHCWQRTWRGGEDGTREHRLQGTALLPMSAFVELALAAAEAVSAGRMYDVVDLQLQHPVFLPEGAAVELQSVLTERGGGYWFQAFRRSAETGLAWKLCASAEVRSVQRRQTHAIRVDVLRGQ